VDSSLGGFYGYYFLYGHYIEYLYCHWLGHVHWLDLDNQSMDWSKYSGINGS
jgi:hypothetical protein